MPIHIHARRARPDQAIRRGRVCLAALLAATAGPLLPAQAQAQAQTQAAGVVLAQAELRPFDIPSQPLTEALILFGRQAGLQTTADAGLVRGQRSAPVSGRMSWEQALRTLLSGTGLSYRRTGSMIALQKPVEGGGAAVLGPITVEGRTESAYGPVPGYVASRSAAATKTDIPIIEVPQSISVIGREQIEAQSPDSLAQALHYAPGVFAESSGIQTDSTGFFLRGFQGGEFHESIYVDGLAGPAVTPVEPYSLERIDILRGPASVLYGRGQPGGIVSLVTKKPTDEELREIQVQAGSFERKQGSFDLSGPATEDRALLYRFTGLMRDSETQIESSNDDRTFLLGSFTWRLSPLTDVTGFAEYQKDDYQFNFGLPAEGTALANPNGELPITRFIGEPAYDGNIHERWSAGYSAKHEVNESFWLRQNVRYTHEEEDRYEIVPRGLQADLRTLNRGTFTRINDVDSLAVDNQAEFHVPTGPLQHKLLLGLDYQREEKAEDSGSGAAPAIDIFTPVYGQTVARPSLNHVEQERQQLGVYVQDQIKIREQWIVTLGGRHDWADAETSNAATGITTEQDDRAFTGRAGLGYEFEIGLVPYVSYGESFLPTSGTDVAGNPFEPETGLQYEAGVKFQPAGYDSYVAAAVYDLRRQNVRTADPNNPGFSVQTGEVTSRGFEIEGVASLGMGLNVTASYAYIDAEVTKSNGTDLGKRPPRVPDHLASIWADYTIGHGPLRGLSLGGGIRYVGDSAGDTVNSFDAPAHTLADARLGYRFDDLELAVNVRNVFDENYVSACFFIGQCNVGQARTVYGTLTYRW